MFSECEHKHDRIPQMPPNEVGMTPHVYSYTLCFFATIGHYISYQPIHTELANDCSTSKYTAISQYNSGGMGRALLMPGGSMDALSL